jgi:hypothetical protein
VELDPAGNAGDAGLAGLAAGKSPTFLVFRGLARSGRSRTKKPGMRIFSKNVARARSAWSGGKAATVLIAACRACGTLIRFGDARRADGDPGEDADGLVDGEQCPHLLHDALGIAAAQHGLAPAHVGFVVADDGLAAQRRG